MSFRCEGCGTAQPPRTSPNLVVVELLERQYNNHGSFSWGFEIKKEKKLCDNCPPGEPVIRRKKRVA